MALGWTQLPTAVFKRQVVNLRSCCILLVDSVESVKMHGLANPKFIKCVFRFLIQLFSEIFLGLRSIKRDVIMKIRSFACKVPVIPVKF